MTHPLTELLKEKLGITRPGAGEADAEDAVDELEGTPPGEGYEAIDDRDREA